jgi:hypothetical protein
MRNKIMAKELVVARFQLKDENNNAILDEEGKATWQEASVEYDFGDNLDMAVEACGADTVFSNFKANARVALQSIVRTHLKAGSDAEKIQAVANAWKPGVVAEKVTVDPKAAFMAAFASYPLEKKLELLKQFGVPEDALASMS